MWVRADEQALQDPVFCLIRQTGIVRTVQVHVGACPREYKLKLWTVYVRSVTRYGEHGCGAGRCRCTRSRTGRSMAVQAIFMYGSTCQHRTRRRSQLWSTSMEVLGTAVNQSLQLQ